MSYLAFDKFFPRIILRWKRPTFTDPVEKIIPRHCAVEIRNQDTHRSYQAHDLLKPRWLAGRRQNCFPPRAIGLDVLFVRDQHFDWDMNVRIVQQSDNQAGFARHSRVHGVAGVEIAKDRIGRISRTTADDVARVKVPHMDWNASLLEILFDLLPEIESDVFQLDVAGGIPLRPR